MKAKPASTIWRNRQFHAYIASTGFSGFALAMQQLMLSWILIGILLLPADQVGLIQAFIGIPGVFLMLLGGASADRSDPRRLLIFAYLLAPIFPLFLIAMSGMDMFVVWTVVVWGLGISVVQALSLPAQQAILNNVTGDHLQKGIAAATAIGFVVQVMGLSLAGQLELIGVNTVLYLQAGGFVIAAATIGRLQLQPISSTQSVQNNLNTNAAQQIMEGLRATVRHRVIAPVLLINFTSSIFNAGSFMTVFPYIVKRIYDGDAFMLAALMALFFTGAFLSNVLLLRFMPLARPGRVYLVAQLSRILVLLLMFFAPSFSVMVLATFLWGLNMGMTTNLSRTIVQESSEATYRGRILSVFTVSMIGSAPIGAIVLGFLIEAIGTLNALLPAVGVSLVLGLYGIFFSPIWSYRSPTVEPATAGAS